mgnify:CR=1 FL=1
MVKEEGRKSYYLTVFVDEKVRTSVAKSSHVARTSLLTFRALALRSEGLTLEKSAF